MVNMSAPRRYRLILSALLGLALLAALYVGVVRDRRELASRRVEIAMDYGDFTSLAQSYGYDSEAFLVSLRRAGLTSLAVSEELGGNINTGSTAYVIAGQQLIAQSKLAPLREPTLAALAKRGALSPDLLYLVIFDPAAVARYREALELHFGSHATTVLHPSNPTILALKSQIDYFGSLGLGLPETPLALARKLQLFLVPRIQNDVSARPRSTGSSLTSNVTSGPQR